MARHRELRGCFLVKAVLQVMRDDKRVGNMYGQSLYSPEETAGLVDV